MASEVLPLVNAVRAKHGKPPLARDANLEAYAGSWAMTMAGMDALVHSSLGKNLSGYREYGQCIAQGQPTAAEAVKGWENHPPHFKIMVGDFDIAGAGFSRGYWCLDVAKV